MLIGILRVQGNVAGPVCEGFESLLICGECRVGKSWLIFSGNKRVNRGVSQGKAIRDAAHCRLVAVIETDQNT